MLSVLCVSTLPFNGIYKISESKFKRDVTRDIKRLDDVFCDDSFY